MTPKRNQRRNSEERARQHKPRSFSFGSVSTPDKKCPLVHLSTAGHGVSAAPCSTGISKGKTDMACPSAEYGGDMGGVWRDMDITQRIKTSCKTAPRQLHFMTACNNPAHRAHSKFVPSAFQVCSKCGAPAAAILYRQIVYKPAPQSAEFHRKTQRFRHFSLYLSLVFCLCFWYNMHRKLSAAHGVPTGTERSISP